LVGCLEKIQPNPKITPTPIKLINLFLECAVSRIMKSKNAMNVMNPNTVCIEKYENLKIMKKIFYKIIGI
jgi:hypothetical protein